MKRILSTHLYGEYADWAERVDTLDRRAGAAWGCSAPSWAPRGAMTR